jgi:1,4-dihydroxy-2-naphthoyl-CoA hydrolase
MTPAADISRIWHATGHDVGKLNAAEQGSMGGHLGIELVEIGENWISARMPVDWRTQQPFGRLSGGASVALAETLGSLAANLTLDPSREAAVGLEVNANHIRPVKDGYVRATARPEALGRTTQVWSIRITDPLERLVCIARLTLSVISVARK